MALTPEQKQRIEKNRQAALERRKRSLESQSQCKITNGLVSTPSSKNICANINGSSKKFCATPTNNYDGKSRFANHNHDSSQHSSQEENNDAVVRERERIERELLPPLSEDAPKLRDATISSMSEQQLEVIKTARPPTPTTETDSNNEDDSQPQPGYMVRVTAAAGTGKTTTLLHLAVRCLDLGHKNVTYVTFSRASAADAKQRILEMMKLHQNESDASQCITASTIHSCAMQLVSNAENTEVEDVEKKLLDDYGLQRLMLKEYAREIQDYLDPALRRMTESTRKEALNGEGGGSTMMRDLPKTLRQKERAMREQVVFYLGKTFSHFVHSNMTFENFSNVGNWGRHHYHVKSKDFVKDGKAEKLGFPPEIYSLEKSYRFYADIIVRFWDYVIQHNIRSYDIEMKKAQLKNLRIPCSVLLVDECQDLDGCQVNFIAKQKQFGTQIFFVGDAAQTIYSFRGARSSHVMSLPHCIDRLLNKSWRFGPAIAQIANVALFAKQYSPQTTKYLDRDTKQWKPYRVEAGRGESESVVVPRSLLKRDWWNKRPVTIIGRKNGTLLKKALELMDLGHLQQDSNCTPELEDGSVMMGNADIDNDKVQADELEVLLSRNMPKFHINGKGESSGVQAWRKAIKMIEHLYDLYMAKDEGGTLPPNIFREFADYDHITWNEFIAVYQARELNNYVKAIDVIMTYGKNTPKAIKVFEKQLDSKYSVDDCDFILTTCHAAKGLEWDHVEICDDFLNLQQSSYVCDHTSALLPPFLSHPNENSESDIKPVKRNQWQFNVKNFGDDLNYIYVACTRAKKTLSLPKTIESLFREFDLIHFCINDFKTAATKPLETDGSMILLEREKKKLNKGEVWALYLDLCLPLRRELGVDENSKIMNSLFEIDDEEEMEGEQIEIETKEEEQSQHFEC